MIYMGIYTSISQDFHRGTRHEGMRRPVAKISKIFKDSPVTALSCPDGCWQGSVVCVYVCVSCPRCLGVSLATCPVLRAGHLRKVSFSAMGNCYPYYTLKRCAVHVCVCVWSAIRREQTL